MCMCALHVLSIITAAAAANMALLPLLLLLHVCIACRLEELRLRVY